MAARERKRETSDEGPMLEMLDLFIFRFIYSPYCSVRCCIMATTFPCLHRVELETWHLANQSAHFENVILSIKITTTFTLNCSLSRYNPRKPLTNEYLLRPFDNVKIRKHLFTITSNKNLVKHKNYRHNVNYYKNHAKGLPSVNALFSLGAPSSGVSSLGRTLSKNYCINICY